MARHIGIVGCSAEGAALCFRAICQEGSRLLGRHDHPEISLHIHPLKAYMPDIDSGNWAGVADRMLSSAEKLAASGADFLICPDNTIHEAFGQVREKSPLPWLHIAEVVAAAAKLENRRCLGILGTRYLMEGPVYRETLAPLGIEARIPPAETREKINDIIFDELVHAQFTGQSLELFQKAIEGLEKSGCDAVVLGCTEIPLLVTPGTSPLPALDSTRLLARAALRKAIAR